MMILALDILRTIGDVHAAINSPLRSLKYVEMEDGSIIQQILVTARVVKGRILMVVRTSRESSIYLGRLLSLCPYQRGNID